MRTRQRICCKLPTAVTGLNAEEWARHWDKLLNEIQQMKLQISKDLWINRRARLIHKLAKRVLEPRVMLWAALCSYWIHYQGDGKKRREDSEGWRGREGQECSCLAAGGDPFLHVHLRILPNVHHSCAQSKTFWESQTQGFASVYFLQGQVGIGQCGMALKRVDLD